MSEEQLTAFMNAVKADEALLQKVMSADAADGIVAIAKAAGFVISADELERAVRSAGLSDSELEGATGGSCEVGGSISDFTKAIICGW